MHYVSPSCRQVLGWTPEEMCDKGPEAFVCAEDLPSVAAAHQRLFKYGVDLEPSTIRMRKKDGTFAWMEINARLVKEQNTGEPDGIVLTMRNITERKLREQELEVFALKDALTGLANRRQFDQVLEREWKHTSHKGAELSLILLDIDYFKQFNDHYGHFFGDDCLRAIAHAVRDEVNGIAGLVARYGGEEMAVILPNTDAAGVLEVAEKVRTCIEALRLPHDGRPTGGDWVTASIGVATAMARHGGTMKLPEGLLLAADRALYQAKHEGRNRVATTYLLASQDTE